jgi:hypothetical protein
MDTNHGLLTSSDQLSHGLQRPPVLTGLGAYLESRGNESGETLFVGLQMILADPFARPITLADGNGGEGERAVAREVLPRGGLAAGVCVRVSARKG